MSSLEKNPQPFDKKGNMGNREEAKNGEGGHENPELKYDDDEWEDIQYHGLESARKLFVNAEEDINELKKLRKLFASKEEKQITSDSLEFAQQNYDKIKRIVLGAETDKFLDERMALVDARAEKAEKGKAYRFWKKLGEQNLAKFYKGEKGSVKFVLSMLSTRTAISGGLLGVGLLAGAGTAVGLGAFFGRRAIAGIGSGVGSYDLLKLGSEKWATSKGMRAELSDEDIAEKSMLAIDIAERMAHFEVQAVLKGESVSDNETYKTLKMKYTESVKDVQYNAEVAEKMIDKESEKVQNKAKWNDRGMKAAGVAIGTLVGSAFWSEDAREQWGEVGKAGKKQVIRAGDFIKDKLSGGGPIARAVQDTVEIDQEAVIEATQTITETASQETVEVAKETFVETAGDGEGYIEQGRKAIKEYLKEKGESLTKAQRIKAESDLFDVLKEKAGGDVDILHPEDKVEFTKDSISQVVDEVKTRFGRGTESGKILTENLKEYTDKVKWEDYKIAPKDKAKVIKQGVEIIQRRNVANTNVVVDALTEKVTGMPKKESKQAIITVGLLLGSIATTSGVEAIKIRKSQEKNGEGQEKKFSEVGVIEEKNQAVVEEARGVLSKKLIPKKELKGTEGRLRRLWEQISHREVRENIKRAEVINQRRLEDWLRSKKKSIDSFLREMDIIHTKKEVSVEHSSLKRWLGMTSATINEKKLRKVRRQVVKCTKGRRTTDKNTAQNILALIDYRLL